MTSKRKLLAAMMSAGIIWNTSALAAVDIPPEVFTQLQLHGTARIVVELEVPWQPEEMLRTAEEAVAQCQQFTDIQQQFLSTLGQELVNNGLPDEAMSVEGTLLVEPEAICGTMPYLALEVNEATLLLVQQQTLVKALILDQAEEPDLAQNFPLVEESATGREVRAANPGTCTGITDGLVGCYSFDGNALDGSGNGNHGTATWNTAYKTGKVGQAVDLNLAVSSYVSIPNPAQKFTTQYTVSGWILTKSETGGIPFGKYSYNAGYGYPPSGFVLGFSNVDWSDVTLKSGRTIRSVTHALTGSPSYTLPLNQFRYVTATYDNGNSKLYIDGKLMGETTGKPLATLDNSYPMLIGISLVNGQIVSYSQGFNGMVDELRVYNRALSDAEVQQLAILSGVEMPTKPTGCDVVKYGLVGCYQFEDNAVNDDSGNANHGICSNGTSFVDGKSGKGLYLNGSSGYCYISNPAQKFTDQYTISAQILPKGMGGAIASKHSWNGYTAGAKGFLLMSGSDKSGPEPVGSTLSTCAINIPNLTLGSTNCAIGYAIPMNSFSHATAVYNAGKVQIYIDGKLVNENTFPHTLTLDNPYNVLLGTYYVNNATELASKYHGAFNGVIDDLRIYNRALSDAEVKQLAGVVEPAKVTLTVTKTGNGQVTGNGITCGTDCTEDLAPNTPVTLTATAEAGSIFKQWTGDCTGTTATVTVTLDQAKSCAATFELIPPPTAIPLTVNKADTGRGRISGRLRGEPAISLTCDNACQSSSYNYLKDGVVIVQATADKGYEFKSWTCTGSGYTQDPATPNILKVTMTTATTCTANFDALPGQIFTLTVKMIGTGSGTVSSSKNGLTCQDNQCTGEYVKGQTLTLTATPTPPSTFVNWGGDCTGTKVRMPLTMNKDWNCTAQFLK